MNYSTNNLTRFQRAKTVLRAWSFLFLIVSAIGCSKSNDPDPQSCVPGAISIVIESAHAPSQCDSQDGSITISATGGTGPYTYAVNTGSTVISQTNPVFNDLFPGPLKIIVKDKFQCSSEIVSELRLASKSGVSYSAQIFPILTDYCNIPACHNGSLGPDKNWTSLAVIQTKLNNMQRVLALSKMPPPTNPQLSAIQRNAILCWIADGAPNN